MRRLLCVVLLAGACSRSSLKVIDRVAAADASDTQLPSDTRPASDNRLAIDSPLVSDTRLTPDSPVAIDTPYINDTRPPDTRIPDSRPADTKPAVNCPSQVVQPGKSNRTVMVGSQNRSYVLYIPDTYTGSQPVPLIFDFHLHGSSGSTQASTSPYRDATWEDSVVMAFPTGLLGPGLGSGSSAPVSASWNLGPCCANQGDDVAFTEAMLDQLQSIVCIDKKRIYAVGNITGGGMAYLLACQMPDVFAAVSASAWDLLKETADACKPARGITVVSFRGNLDMLVPYSGGPSSLVSGMPINFLGAIGTFKKWALINSCPGEAKDDGKGCSRYSNCRDGAEVVLCTKPNGGSEVGDPDIAWPLFKAHPLP
jgi:polyhydroxybutyrate depolymerase